MEKDSVTPQDVEQAMAASPEAVADEVLLQQIAGEDIDAQLSSPPLDRVEPLTEANSETVPSPEPAVRSETNSGRDSAVSESDMAALKAVVVTEAEPIVSQRESGPVDSRTSAPPNPIPAKVPDVPIEEGQGDDLDSQLAALQQVVREIANADDDCDPFAVSLEVPTAEPMGTPDEMFEDEQVDEDEAIVDAELDATAEITVVEEELAEPDQIEEIQVARPLRLSAPLIKLLEWLDHPLANISAENRLLIGLIGILTAAMAITSWIISIIKGSGQ